MKYVLSSNGEFKSKLTDIIEVNLTNPQFGVSFLAREMGMSRSNLHRRVKTISDQSISQFIRHVRLKKALEMLNQTSLTCSEIAYNVGFGSVSYFNKCFHEYFGYPPGEFIKKGLGEKYSDQNMPDKIINSKNPKKLYSVASVFLLIVVAQAILGYLLFKPFDIGISKKVKTIIVLPFTDISEHKDITYILKGLREDLIGKLDIIDELNVVSTDNNITDSDIDIRNKPKSIKADYILSGSGQGINDVIKIRLQLSEVSSGKFIWYKPLSRNLNEENIIHFQDEAALLIANELNTIATEKEKELISTHKTENTKAYDHYLMGKDYLDIYDRLELTEESIPDANITYTLEMAKISFKNALENDTAYIKAYVGLGWYYHSMSNVICNNAAASKSYLDTALIMAERAIQINPDYPEAYDLQSCILACKGMVNECKVSSDRLVSLNQGWRSYHRVAKNYSTMKLYSKAIRYFLMAKKFNNNYIVNNDLLNNMYSCFAQSGFKNEAISLLEELLSQENDSLKFLHRISKLEYVTGNTETALQYQLKAYSLDSLNPESTLKLCKFHAILNNRDKMLDYFNKYILLVREKNYKEIPDKYTGYLYLILGHKEKSDYHFNKVLERNIRVIEIGAANESNYAPEYEIACIYSAKGEINKALEYLMHYKKKKSCPAWLISSLKQNPMLNQVRQNSEFEKILEHLEFNFNKEHNKTENVLLNEGIFQL